MPCSPQARPTIRTFGADGEPVGMEVQLFIQAFAPKPDMYIFGAIDFSRAMARIGKYLGYFVTVVDARPIFATKGAHSGCRPDDGFVAR